MNYKEYKKQYLTYLTYLTFLEGSREKEKKLIFFFKYIDPPEKKSKTFKIGSKTLGSRAFQKRKSLTLQPQGFAGFQILKVLISIGFQMLTFFKKSE